MKNKLVFKITGIFLLCFLMFTTTVAQPKFGVRAGVNISNQEFKQGDLNIQPKTKYGLDLGFVTNFPLGEVVSFAPELHWLQKGFTIEDFHFNGLVMNGTSTLNYLELPLLIKFNFGETAKFFVMGGPSFGYLLSDKTVDDNGNEIDLGDRSNIELGAHFGAGIGVGPVIIDVRYLLGITNLAKDIPDAEVHNTGFGAGISLMF
ncbi:MAG TPA: porin family protein [Saprospiraceae bacterium]|nr:porin family protein [Saprospiraceae bacterium]